MKNEIKKVQKRICKLGYSVRDYSGCDVNFDLLVSGKIKVIVGKENPQSIPDNCDVFALVKNGYIIYYVRPIDGMVGLTKARDAFGKI
jgi:hypothetical protein